jgi:hypothetical protein
MLASFIKGSNASFATNALRRAPPAMLEGEAEVITPKAIELAKAGDLTALRLCLDRLLPVRRDRLDAD